MWLQNITFTLQCTHRLYSLYTLDTLYMQLVYSLYTQLVYTLYNVHTLCVRTAKIFCWSIYKVWWSDIFVFHYKYIWQDFLSSFCMFTSNLIHKGLKWLVGLTRLSWSGCVDQVRLTRLVYFEGVKKLENLREFFLNLAIVHVFFNVYIVTVWIVVQATFTACHSMMCCLDNLTTYGSTLTTLNNKH